ncbi:MAG: asparagine--tRNA ligase [Clostridiaceae bacterium]|jgi:asparaginyl-tRNA synthetase|nr:asparagine--tRNA ligase [Bacillota bacterium]NLN52428.1 asparagine--tRNA ligase [Clostridiaceae bacterium]
MAYTLIRDLFCGPEEYADQTITVGGWIRTIRDQKNFGFITLNDGTFFKPLQIVFERDLLENFDEIAKIGNGASITAKGRIVITPDAKQPFEMKAAEIILEGDSPEYYPLQPKRHSPEFLRTIAHLRPRTNLFSAVFRVRSEASFAIHKFFHDRNFVYVHTPIITSSDAEGAGEMFRVSTIDPKKPPLTEEGKVNYKEDFFGKEAHLTVSGQLAGEAFALAFRNIYTFGPTFRAENSNTARHAAEFWMIEPEISFADLYDVAQLAEDMIKAIISHVLETCPEEMAFFNQFIDKGLLARLETVLNSKFAYITYTEAIEELLKADVKFEYPVEWGVDLQTEHERYLTEKVFQGPVFVTNYPKDIKAFYMKLNPDGKTVAAMDCLVPGIGEIVGGSQREEDLEILNRRIDEMGLKAEDYNWYLELREYGSIRHAGFGLGFERMIMYLTGVNNIRDVLPFPRTVGHAEY